MSSSETIHALATGSTRAGLAIMRISGPRSAAILRSMAGNLPQPRRATLRGLRDSSGEMIDRGLVLWFPAPGSFTGEDVVEFHVHGGHAIVSALDRQLQALGSRPADAGEFTRRAFLNAKLDLLEAEAIVDLIDAETDAQRQQALAQSGGALSAVYRGWAEQLREVLALQEARLDFPDETDDATIDADVIERVDTLIDMLSQHLAEGRQAERLRTGIVICVTGEPNVGKSSLVNRLVREDVSIVSEQSGTTRDLVEARLVLAGVPVTLIDTAGLRETDDEVEAEGIRRARAKAAGADLVLEIVVGGSARVEAGANVMRIANKIDLDIAGATDFALRVSAQTGAGVAHLMDVLAQRVRDIAGRTSHPAMTRGRHRSCLETARGHLREARQATEADILGEELRLAMRAIGRLTGEVDVEDVLDTIFSTFCVGK